jgi:hypothetical protein
VVTFLLAFQPISYMYSRFSSTSCHYLVHLSSVLIFSCVEWTLCFIRPCTVARYRDPKSLPEAEVTLLLLIVIIIRLCSPFVGPWPLFPRLESSGSGLGYGRRDFFSSYIVWRRAREPILPVSGYSGYFFYK